MLAEGEILVEIRISIPLTAVESISYYYKVGQRKALAISIASMAVCLQMAQDGTVLVAKFAWGSVSPRVMVFPELDQSLLGEKLTEDSLRNLGTLVSRQVTPIDDLRASAEYRRVVVANLPIKLLAEFKAMREQL